MTTILPLLVVFDLDFTLWPLFVSAVAPFSKNEDGEVVDKLNCTCEYYPEVPAIFEKLKNFGIKIGIVSNNVLEEVNQLTKLFDWDKYISFREVFLIHDKTEHLINIQNKSKIPFDKMIFFDDDEPIIKIGQTLGIFSVFVGHNGMKMNTLENTLKEYEVRQQKMNILENALNEYELKQKMNVTGVQP